MSIPLSVPAILAIKHKLMGRVESNQSTCAASTIGIGNAYREIKHGYLDMCVAGGFDIFLNT